MHEIIVENVGTVYYGDSEHDARFEWDNYAGRYKPWGCDWYATVTWIEGDDIRREYYDQDRGEDCDD